MKIIAKSVKPVKWQRRARIRNNLCVETLYDEPKSVMIRLRQSPDYKRVSNLRGGGLNTHEDAW